MNKLRSLYMLALGMAAMGSDMNYRGLRPKVELTDYELLNKYREKMKSQGLKQFFIDGNEIWALNEKNAYRKFRKHLLTTQPYNKHDQENPKF